MFANKNILITGGTGSFGNELIKKLTSMKTNKPKKIIIFSRDELKQFNLQKKYPIKKYPNLRFFLGDIRDKDRLKMAFFEVDYIIHAAALKQVPAAEYNPIEFIKTNILGAQNIIEASIECGVKKVIALSTDKASSPINLYGATKLCSDKLFLSANSLSGSRKTIFSVVRYGNVFGSRGSVAPFFLEHQKKGFLPVTNINMTRFNILLEDAVKLVYLAIQKGIGGEIFIPKTPSFKITDLAKAISPKCKLKIIGIREGEKIHEELISKAESIHAFDLKTFYVICGNEKSRKKYSKNIKNKVKEGFVYNSLDNKKYLSVAELKTMAQNIKKNKL
ncbi:UDP-N-acetylglucosamine 4,6-dehydratase (inverting) [Candidatus Pelagibacter sp.]|nr:UDP-N-acetylglucosamine 4,6-dehydratase (inverting) [Candidatus Pelagibacter sp.]